MEIRIAWDSFVDPGFRFEIDFPMDWKVETDSASGHVTFQEPVDRNVLWLTQVQVHSAKGSGITDMNQLAEQRKKEVAAEAPNYEFLKSAVDLHSCGSHAILHTYMETIENGNLIGYEMLLNVPGEIRVYYMTAKVLQEKFQDWEPVFLQMFNTFKFSRGSGKWMIRPEDLLKR